MSATSPQTLTQKDFEDKPWKYIGYEGYSEFIASEYNFLVFRRFNAANTRVMLALQDEVSELTEKLKQMDERYSDKSAKDVNNGTLRHDQRDRKALIENLHESLVKYSQLSCVRIRRRKREAAH
jgi:hypothetical protein